jgi:hypothetical protein
MNRLRFSSWLLLSLASAWAYAAQEPSPEQLLLKDFRPRSIYKVPVTSMAKARFPVIDMHSHDYAKTDEQIAEWVRTMDELGIKKSVILSCAHGKEFDAVLARYRKFPGRFSVWCGFDYTGYDHPGYGPAALAELERCFQAGAEGVGEEGDKGKGWFYDWDLFTYHWPLNGFGLNDRILKEVYSENAQKILERRIGIKP